MIEKPKPRPSLENAEPLSHLIDSGEAAAQQPAIKNEHLEHYEASMSLSSSLPKVALDRNAGHIFSVGRKHSEHRRPRTNLYELRNIPTTVLEKIKLTPSEQKLMDTAATMPWEELHNGNALAEKLGIAVSRVTKVKQDIERKVAAVSEDKPLQR